MGPKGKSTLSDNHVRAPPQNTFAAWQLSLATAVPPNGNDPRWLASHTTTKPLTIDNLTCFARNGSTNVVNFEIVEAKRRL